MGNKTENKNDEDKTVRRSVEVCRQCFHFQEDYQSLFTWRKPMMICELDMYTASDGGVKLKAGLNDSEYEKLNISKKKCICWADQCLHDWNK